MPPTGPVTILAAPLKISEPRAHPARIDLPDLAAPRQTFLRSGNTATARRSGWSTTLFADRAARRRLRHCSFRSTFAGKLSIEAVN